MYGPRHISIGALAFLLTHTAIVPVVAADSASETTAEALFRKGREAEKQGDHVRACTYFTESQALDPAPGTLLNLALCEEKLGRIATAWMHAQQLLTGLAAGDDRRPIAERLIERVEPRLPRLQIDLAPSLAGATVALDGAQLSAASLGLMRPVDPGAHVVEASLGVKHVRVELTVAEREQRKELLSEAAPVASSGLVTLPTAVETYTAPSHPYRTAGIVFGSAGVAALAVTSAAVYGMFAAKHDADAICVAEPCADPGAQHAANDRGRRWSTVATSSFVVGAVAIGLGSYFFFAKRESSAARIGLAAEPHAGFLSLSTIF